MKKPIRLQSSTVFNLAAATLLFCMGRQQQAGAQTSSIQDCIGAIPVCQKVYVENKAPLGFGTQSDFNPANTCITKESNSIWYTFTVNKSGKFGFLLTPHDSLVDYDWILFNITDASCDDLFHDPTLVVSCNAAGGVGCFGPTGATGGTPFDDQGPNCGTFPPDQDAGFSPLNDLIDVQKGNTYVLCINNFLASDAGYTLDFGLSTDIGIFDTVPPAIKELKLSDGCKGTSFNLAFSEFIQCPTIASAYFQLNGPGGPYSLSLSGVACDNGGNFEKKFTLQVSPPVTLPGNYTFRMVTNGTTQVLDLCGLPAAPQTVDFSFDQLALPLDLGDDATLCPGQTLTLNPGIAGAVYQWQDGSTNPTFVVNAPGTYAVTVTTACSSASDTIVVAYLPPPPPVNLGPDTVLCEGSSLLLNAAATGGSYLWQDGSTSPTFTVSKPGQYSVLVTSGCGSTQDAITIDFIPDITVQLGNIAMCDWKSILLDVTSKYATYLWQDGSTAPLYQINHPGQYSVVVSTACESKTLFSEVSILPSDPVFDLGPDTLLCPGEQLLLNIDKPGYDLRWQDGSTSPQYIVTQSGTYSLEVSNICSTSSDEIRVRFEDPLVVSLGQDTFLCPGDILFLRVETNATEYKWEDGTSTPNRTVKQPGTYAVVASSECETVTASVDILECEMCAVYVPNVFSPNDDGLNDVFAVSSECPLADFNLKIFDRWGGLVHEMRSAASGWDGRFQNKRVGQGLFVYVLEYRVEENGAFHTYRRSGDLTVVR